MSELKVNHNEAIDFTQSVSSAPYYSMTRVFQQIGGQTVAVSANSTTQAIFDIPSKVLNWSKSYLTFDIAIPAQGAGVAGALLTHAPPINRLALYTRGGQYLCDIQNFDAMWKACSPANIKLDDFQATTSTTNQATTALAKQRGGLLRFNNPAGLAFANPPVGAVNSCNATKIEEDGLALEAGIKGRREFSTKNQVIFSGANAVLAVGCLLSFSEIPYCMLNMNKDFYCAENLQLLVEFSPVNRFAFQTAHPIANPFAALPIAIGGNATVDNLCLYLSCEENATVRDAVVQKFQSQGLSYTVPYCHVLVNNLGASTSGSIIAKINKGHGQRLLRVISGERIQANTLSLSNNMYNHDPAAYTTTSYYTTLDSSRLQPQDLSITDGTAIMYNKQKLKQTPLENGSEYATEAPIHIDDWSACDSLFQAREKDYSICGLDLSIERNYQKFVNKTATNTDEVYVVVTQKTLQSSPMGVVCQ